MNDVIGLLNERLAELKSNKNMPTGWKDGCVYGLELAIDIIKESGGKVGDVDNETVYLSDSNPEFIARLDREEG